MTLAGRTQLLSPLALAAGLACCLAAAAPVQAQDTPALWPGIRMFRGTMLLEANMAQSWRQAQHYATVAPEYHTRYSTYYSASVQPTIYSPPRVSPLKIVITTPPPSVLQPEQPALFANIRGPDGTVRRVPLAGQDTIQPRSIVVHPGESVTLRFMAAAPAPAAPSADKP